MFHGMVIAKSIVVVKNYYLFDTKCYECDIPITVITRPKFQKHGIYNCTKCMPNCGLRNGIDEPTEMDVRHLILNRGKEFSLLRYHKDIKQCLLDVLII